MVRRGRVDVADGEGSAESMFNERSPEEERRTLEEGKKRSD